MSKATEMQKDSFNFAPLQDYVGNLGNIPDAKSKSSVPPIRIAVLTNRFVYIGRCEIRYNTENIEEKLTVDEDTNALVKPIIFAIYSVARYIVSFFKQPQWLIMSAAHNLRIWGTEKGLGELTQGPTKATAYDKVGIIYVPYSQVVHVIDVRQDTWKLE